MLIPTLAPSERDREYKLRSFEEVSRVVHTWLFSKDLGTREIDKKILGLDPEFSKGWQSMGVLHYLGLNKEFKGIFLGMQLNEAIEFLKSDAQDFGQIIELLESTVSGYEEKLAKDIYDFGKAHVQDFDAHFKLRLEEMKDTEGPSNKGYSRKEQAALRGVLFKGEPEAQCAICLRTFPTQIMVAGHIKPRSKCNTKERLNPNVVMPVCKVGCDDFFEKGYIFVDQKGIVQTNQEMNCSNELKAILSSLNGNRCSYFKSETENFFSYRRDLLTKGQPHH